MIIRCEQCDTRFQLDDARIPDQGARVRCSLCKHAFFVQRPAVSEDAAVDAVAAEAIESESPATPSTAWDLDASSPPRASDSDAFQPTQSPLAPGADAAASALGDSLDVDVEEPIEEPAADTAAADVAQESLDVDIEEPIEEPAADTVAADAAQESLDVDIEEPAADTVAADAAQESLDVDIEEPAADTVAADAAQESLDVDIEEPAADTVAADAAQESLDVDIEEPAADTAALDSLDAATEESLAAPTPAAVDRESIEIGGDLQDLEEAPSGHESEEASAQHTATFDTDEPVEDFGADEAGPAIDDEALETADEDVHSLEGDGGVGADRETPNRSDANVFAVGDESHGGASAQRESDWEFEPHVPGGPATADLRDEAADAPELGAEAPEGRSEADSGETSDSSPAPANDETAVFSAALEENPFADGDDSTSVASPDSTETDDDSGASREEEASASSGASLDEEPDSYYDLDGEGDSQASGEVEDSASPDSNDADDEGLGELGDPSSWDLERELEDAGALEPGDGWTWDPEATPASAELGATPTEAVPSPEALAPSRSARSVPVAQIVGWTAVSALVGLGLWALLLSPAPSLDSTPMPTSAPVVLVSGLEVVGLEARPLENLNVGMLWVVSGRIHNPSSTEQRLGKTLQVQVLGADGAAVAEATAVPRIATVSLRESPPAVLRAAEPAGSALLAGTVVGPGESVVFEAVLESMPSEAATLRVEGGPAVEVAPGPDGEAVGEEAA